MQCLYCGKGIGPIRQLRDLEFCSEAHRTQFRERYRQQVYEALAPEPAPAPVADFMGRAVAAAGPAPYSALGVLQKAAPEEFKPALQVQAAGLFLETAGWAEQTPAAMPAHPVWDGSTAALAAPIWVAALPAVIAPASRNEAGEAETLLTPKSPARRPASAAPHISVSGRLLSLPDSVSLPAASHVFAPHHAAPSQPQLQAALPVPGEPEAAGAVASALHGVSELPLSAAIGAPVAPAGQDAARTNISPATITSCPRPGEAGPLPVHCAMPAAIETAGSSNSGMSLPNPPTGTAHSGLTAAPPSPFELHVSAEIARASKPVEASRQSLAALAPRSRPADPLPAVLPAASPAWHAARPAGTVSPVSQPPRPAQLHNDRTVAPIGALAELLHAGGATAQEAAGNRDPYSVVTPAPARVSVPQATHEWQALGGSLDSAPPFNAMVPQSAAPPAAAPSWDSARNVPADRTLVPTASIALPILRLPEPAGKIGEAGGPLPPAVGRAVRACAVLWTLRVTRVCGPDFNVAPIRAKFNDLVRGARSAAYLADGDSAKNNLRPFRRITQEPSRKQKWQYIGAAAAALLLAAAMRPEMLQKTFGKPSPWQGVSVRQWMTSRATRSFEDDFRSGLNQWKGMQAQLPKNWSYSPDGFMHPGQLALYRPSVPLSDYRFEFMAQIESKSVDWVVRAQNADNYYALKFTVLQPGPRPVVAMVRYPVIDGARGARIQTPLRMMVHANTPYRVTVDVKGNKYRAFIEGQEADFWTEDRLKTGGVGFFTEAGERARVYWVKLESQGDLLGRICGMLSGKGGEGTTDKEKEANGLPACRKPGQCGLQLERCGNSVQGRGDAHQPRVVASCIIAPRWQARGGGPGTGPRSG